MVTCRRTVLAAGATALGTALLGGCGTGRYAGPARPVTIAGGQQGGLYVEFANLLAVQLSTLEPGLRGQVSETAGSVDNVRRVCAGRADLGIAQADVARAAIRGTTDTFTSPLSVRAIGRVYEDYLQLVVRRDSLLKTVADLSGRTVSLGVQGSGTTMTALRLIDVAGLRVIGRNDALESAAKALASGAIDALMWVGGVPTPTLATLHRQVGIRVLPLEDQLSKLRDTYGPAYQHVVLPAGAYGQTEVPTVGVANLLVSGTALPDDVAAAVTRTLVRRANQLVPQSVVGTQFLDPHTLIGTLDIPMHAGAAAAYRDLHG